MPSLISTSADDFSGLTIPYSCACTEKSPRAIQPPHISIPLRPHQLAEIQRMVVLERQLRDGLDISDPESVRPVTKPVERLYSRYGVLGDPVGVGKSLIVLGHIATLKNSSHTDASCYTMLSRFSNRNLFSIVTDEYRDISNCPALIIVPHTLFNQWAQYIQTQTTLNAFILKTKSTLLSANFLTRVVSADVVLVSNTILRDFITLTHHRIFFTRVYIDEADTIVITASTDMPKLGFLWFITSTWQNIIFANKHVSIPFAAMNRLVQSPYFSILDADLREQVLAKYAEECGLLLAYSCKSYAYNESYLRGDNPHKSYVVVRCSEQFIQQSVVPVQLQTEQIVCSRPLSDSIALSFLSSEMQEMLNADNTAAVYEQLGIKTDILPNILHAITESKVNELEEVRKSYTFKSVLDYDTSQERKDALEPYLTKIQNIEGQIDAIRERVENYTHEICPICYEEPKPTSALLTPCCTRIFCAFCILQSLSKIGCCPLCRTATRPDTLTSVTTNIVRHSAPIQQIHLQKRETKLNTLMNLILTHPKEKFVVFSKFDGTFACISGPLLLKNIHVRELKGNKNVFKRVLDDFEKGDLKVILVNQSTSGLNISSTTYVVLWHTMMQADVKQILGQTHPHHLVKLVYPEEIEGM